MVDRSDENSVVFNSPLKGTKKGISTGEIPFCNRHNPYPNFFRASKISLSSRAVLIS